MDQCFNSFEDHLLQLKVVVKDNDIRHASMIEISDIRSLCRFAGYSVAIRIASSRGIPTYTRHFLPLKQGDCRS
jgi:hypothetical protein